MSEERNIVTTFLHGLYRRLRFLSLSGRKNPSWDNKLAFILILAATVCGSATFAALNALPPFGDDPSTIFWLLNLDLIILLLLVTLIARRVVSLRSGRRRGLAGARLHVRLVFIFSLLAAVPAIIMTIFSTFFLHYGVQSWFSEQISTAVNESQAVATAYLAEHQQVIRADTLAMANDLNRQKNLLMSNQLTFNKVMQTQSILRNLSEVMVFDGTGRVLARYGMSAALTFASVPGLKMLEAGAGDVVLMTGGNDDRVRALVKLHNFPEAYLFVGRMVDPTVLRHLADTKQAVDAYEQLEKQRADLQIKITMMFVLVALLLLFAAIWLGLVFARQLVMPISALISTAERVRSGDLTARVPDFERQDEIAILGHAFNRMTRQIEEQRDELVMTNRQLDERRRFTEAVLASVPSGIIGVDKDGKITLVNASATELFQIDAHDIVGKVITDVIPEVTQILAEAFTKLSKLTQDEIAFTGKDQTRRIFLIRIAIELTGEDKTGAVLTFDDITELQSAQRKAAWSDVARRIAHEIKNPLTPIQLSAERLKRKYLKQIHKDPEIFSQCTDTIIHHVEDIGRMVNEFSAFARMPEPVMQQENLLKHIRDILVFQQQAHKEISFKLVNENKEPIEACFDGQLIRQAFTNILQNAIDSIHTRKDVRTGHINVLVHAREDSDDIVIALTDDGIGLPKDEDLTRLTDPYVTHREKGTGLGLAIVKKIMDEHQGHLVLGAPDWLKKIEGWEDIGGATVVLVLPVGKSDLVSGDEVEKNQAIA